MLSVALMLSLAAAPKIQVHSAGDPGFRANSYLVETDKGVIAIDAQFTVSEAKAFRAKLDALNKPLLAVLVTHAHPDHVNGITQLVEGKGEVPVVSTAGVKKTLEAIDAPKRAYWSPIYKDEYPAKTTFPSRLVKDGETISFGGATFRAHDLGAGESDSETVWVLEGKEKAAFTGDLVMNRVHPWLAEGRSAEWIRSLDKAGAVMKGAKTVYPGHGEPGSPEIVAWQKSYLQAYRAAVKELAAGKASLTDDAKKELAARMEKVLPGGALAMLVGMSADSVAAELTQAKTK